MAAGKLWTPEELLVALNVYHKLTFGQLHARNPVIAQVAEKLGRGANSLAMKLCNLASLDPALKLRGINGLPGASNLDRQMWDEFHKDLERNVPDSEDRLRKLFAAKEGAALEVLPKEGIRIRKGPPDGPTDVYAQTRLRRGQEYFRDAVLNNFGGKCGITGLAIRELLVASHILPWAAHPAERLNVRNGICLSRLHDAAFDRGLISFDHEFRLILSDRLNDQIPSTALSDNFGKYEGKTLLIPDDAAFPHPQFIAEHRRNIFRL